MKSLRKLFLLLFVIVALVAAGLIESFNLLAAKHRDQVIQELQKVLGQDVSFAKPGSQCIRPARIRRHGVSHRR